MDWLTGGRFGSCRLSAMFCITSIFAWQIFLISSFRLFFYRGLKGNIFVLKVVFMVIAVLVGLIPFAWSLCVVWGCVSSLDKGQFWHQDLSVDSIMKYALSRFIHVLCPIAVCPLNNHLFCNMTDE